MCVSFQIITPCILFDKMRFLCKHFIHHKPPYCLSLNILKNNQPNLTFENTLKVRKEAIQISGLQLAVLLWATMPHACAKII